jgi:hypothetical protein
MELRPGARGARSSIILSINRVLHVVGGDSAERFDQFGFTSHVVGANLTLLEWEILNDGTTN